MHFLSFALFLTMLVYSGQIFAEKAVFASVDDALAESDFSGVVWVAMGNDVMHANAFGYANREGNVKFTVNTVFDIGSITKQFVATAIMTLVEQEKLSLSDPITVFFADVPADKQAISVHHLLTHSAGLPANLTGHQLYDVVSAEELPELVFKERLLAQPGKQYSYSNLGYSLLAKVIEHITGQNWEAYIHKVLLLPAGLKETGYRLPEYSTARLAINYGADQNAFQKLFGLQAKSRSVGHSLTHLTERPGERWIEGAGGFMSTVSDMHRWFLAIRDRAILTTTSWQTILTPHVQSANNASYGYGWAIQQDDKGRLRITHNGSNGYSFAEFTYFPAQDVFVFVATNDIDNYPGTLIEQLVEAALIAKE